MWRCGVKAGVFPFNFLIWKIQDHTKVPEVGGEEGSWRAIGLRRVGHPSLVIGRKPLRTQGGMVGM